MSAQLVTLTRAKREPDPEVVQAAEDLLAYAKSGEIRSLAWCTEEHDRTVSTRQTSVTLGMLTAASRMLHRMHVTLDAGMVAAPPPEPEAS